jgi:hypothetical protein
MHRPTLRRCFCERFGIDSTGLAAVSGTSVADWGTFNSGAGGGSVVRQGNASFSTRAPRLHPEVDLNVLNA